MGIFDITPEQERKFREVEARTHGQLTEKVFLGQFKKHGIMLNSLAFETYNCDYGVRMIIGWDKNGIKQRLFEGCGVDPWGDKLLVLKRLRNRLFKKCKQHPEWFDCSTVSVEPLLPVPEINGG